MGTNNMKHHFPRHRHLRQRRKNSELLLEAVLSGIVTGAALTVGLLKILAKLKEE